MTRDKDGATIEVQAVDHDQSVPRRPFRLALRLLAFGAILSGAPLIVEPLPGAAFGGSPPSTTTPTGPVSASKPGGIHYQVLPMLPHETTGQAAVASPRDLTIFIPRPPFDTWDSVSVSSTAPCLELGSLVDPGPGFVLVQAAEVVGELLAPATEASEVLAAGLSCDAVVDVGFTSETSTWETALTVHIFRPVAALFSGDDISASSRVSRLATTPGTARLRVLLLEVTVSNLTGETIELLGLADPDGIRGAKGRAYRIPDGRYLGTVQELQDLTGAIQNTEIAPNDSMRLGLVFDADAVLARTGGTLTAQPAVLVRTGGEVYTLLLSRVSTTWGDELP